MDSKEWHDKFSEVIDENLMSIQERTEKLTGADLGLILSILEEYSKDPEKNAGRCEHALNLAGKLLNVKYETEELPWFDIHNMVQSRKMSFRRDSDHQTMDSEQVDISSLEDPKASHTREFQDALREILDVIESEEAEKLRENNPYGDPDVNLDAFSRGLSRQAGFLYGSTEIPDNLSRMRLSISVGEYFRNLQEDEKRWIVYRISE